MSIQPLYYSQGALAHSQSPSSPSEGGAPATTGGVRPTKTPCACHCEHHTCCGGQGGNGGRRGAGLSGHRCGQAVRRAGSEEVARRAVGEDSSLHTCANEQAVSLRTCDRAGVQSTRVEVTRCSRGPASVSLLTGCVTPLSAGSPGDRMCSLRMHTRTVPHLSNTCLPSQMSRQGLVRIGDAPIPSLQPPGAQLTCWQSKHSMKLAAAPGLEKA